jgi:hypothetical protein
MDNEALRTKIKGLLRDDREATAAFKEVLRELRALASAIEDSLVPDKITVRVEAGHRVNLGQQYSFVMRVPGADLQDVLLRAYVPGEGFPVTLDLFSDERPKCSSIEALEATILEFLANPDVKQRLLEAKDLAA